MKKSKRVFSIILIFAMVCNVALNSPLANAASLNQDKSISSVSLISCGLAVSSTTEDSITLNWISIPAFILLV